jgi:hypothetical protein
MAPETTLEPVRRSVTVSCDAAEASRAGYETGWIPVLDRFVARCG